MNKLLLSLTCAALILGFSAGAAQAQSLPAVEDLSTQEQRPPKWEAGVAALAFTTPDYPGSNEYQTLVLPAPYFSYRGKVLRSDDEEGSRLRRALTPNMEFNVSGGGELASDSGDSDARRGMPDLDYLLEAGPNLRLSYAGPKPKSKFLINLPLRGVISVGSGIDWRGAVFAPQLVYVSQRFLNGRLSLRLSVGSDFGSTALQRYYYEVAPKYATDTRPAYDAKSGYLGSSVGSLVSYTFTPRLRGLFSLSYANHAGAANEDSPLLTSENTYTALVGVSWSFYLSSARAED